MFDILYIIPGVYFWTFKEPVLGCDI